MNKGKADANSKIIIRGNYVYDTHDDPIEFKPGQLDSIIEQNLIETEATEPGIHVGYESGYSIPRKQNLVIRNNIVHVNGRGSGIGNNAQATITSNTIYYTNSAKAGIHVDDKGAGHSIKIANNKLVGPASNDIKTRGSNVSISNNGPHVKVASCDDPTQNGGDDPVAKDTNSLLPIEAVSASDADGENVALNTLDGDLTTRWSAKGDGQWLQFELGSEPYTVSQVAIAWHVGDSRTANFTIETSLDGTNWSEVYRGTSSGTTLDLETYDFAPVSACYVRVVGYGNSNSAWNSLLEVEVYGQ